MTIQALTAAQINSLTSTTHDPYAVSNGGTITGILSPITSINSLQINDHTYQGKMVTAQHTVSDTDPGICKIPVGEFKDMIKKELLHKLLDEIVKSNLIEFTSQSDYATGQTYYRARIFATPDTQVRLIRKSMKD